MQRIAGLFLVFSLFSFVPLAWGQEAQIKQALALLNGEGESKNCPQSIQMLEELAAQKNAQAATILSSIYDKALCGQQDVHKAVMWQQKAAIWGSGVSIYFLGKRYLEGDGVPTDIPKALQLFLRGAQRGDPDSAAQAGLLLLQTGHDDEKAFGLIEGAAKAGVPEAQYVLSQLLWQGRGGKQDWPEALRWLATAAKRGHKQAGEVWSVLAKTMMSHSQTTELETEGSKGANEKTE